MEGAPAVEAAITRLCKAGALEIEVDLRDLRFVDSSGVRAIVWARQECAEHRAQFFVVASKHPAPRRLFELMKLDEVLPWREASARD